MADLINIRLSKRANEIAEELVGTGKFENIITAAKFGLGYALKHYFDEFNPLTFEPPDSDGSNYNVGSVDPDRKMADLLTAIYPDTETPYMYARNLMVYGLIKIGEQIDTKGMPSVADLCR